jgi:hypothetical protein
MMFFLFFKLEKQIIAFVTVSFYSAEEMKKGCFIAVISKHKWY